MNVPMTKHATTRNALIHVVQVNVEKAQNAWPNNIEPAVFALLELKEIR